MLGLKIIAIVLAVIIGVIIGVLCLALCIASGRANRALETAEENSYKQDNSEK